MKARVSGILAATIFLPWLAFAQQVMNNSDATVPAEQSEKAQIAESAPAEGQGAAKEEAAPVDAKTASEDKADIALKEEAAKETPDRFLDAPEATGGKLPIQGMGRPGQLSFQPPATGIMYRLENMHHWLLYLITGITLFVLGLMIYIAVRFNEKRNPVPSKTTHNSVIEAVWTIIPILILVAIAIPSLRLHYNMAVTKDPEMTIKVVGYQWYWHYEYPDHGKFGFDSYMIKDADRKEGDIRLLSVDNKLIVPVDTTIRVLITAGDVIHSFSVPAFGIKRDAIPGRLNETWFRADKVGVYFGQCSQLCGIQHGFMPVEVHVVSKEDFARWVEEAKKKYADAGNVQLALN